MFLSEWLLADLLALVVALVTIFITYYKWSFTYWERKKLSFLEPKIPLGNISSAVKRQETFGLTVKKIYDEMKNRNWKHAGVYFFSSPVYFPIDLDYIKNVLTKDFPYFIDRGLYYNEKDDPLTAHLFAIGGTKWRNLRAKLSPTFTSGKMKTMFQTLVDCETNLLKKVGNLCDDKKSIDIKDVFGCYTTDIIGSCAFGLECNTFEDEDSPFRKYGKKVFALGSFRRFMLFLSITFPNLARALRVRITPRDVSDFFTKVVRDNVEHRERNGYERKDFMQMLIDLKNNKAAEDEGYQHDGKTLTLDEIAAQSFVFFLAGFETSSTTVTFALYELARNQEVQKKVREEIRAVLVKHGGNVSYEAIQDMKYMNQVLNETLRKYPPVPFITRECVKDYKVTDEDITIDKGTKVIIPIMGIHYDEEYYPDPEKFDPERFNAENSASRHQYAHIPFGEGPRICIGLRFGLMQSKVGLTALLSKYNFSVNKKTKVPLDFDVDSTILSAQGNVWLDAERI